MIAEQILGSLDEALTALKNKPSDKCGVYYLTATCEVPYIPYSVDDQNHSATIVGKSAECAGVNKAKCVGIRMMDTGDVTELLVSDSFGPCVPVIAIGNGKRSLAHFDGPTPSLVKTISDNCNANQYSTILVIQRESPQKNINVSDDLVKRFEGLKIQGLKVELVKVQLNGNIGVMVIGLSVLVYPM